MSMTTTTLYEIISWARRMRVYGGGADRYVSRGTLADLLDNSGNLAREVCRIPFTPPLPPSCGETRVSARSTREIDRPRFCLSCARAILFYSNEERGEKARGKKLDRARTPSIKGARGWYIILRETVKVTSPILAILSASRIGHLWITVRILASPRFISVGATPSHPLAGLKLSAGRVPMSRVLCKGAELNPALPMLPMLLRRSWSGWNIQPGQETLIGRWRASEITRCGLYSRGIIRAFFHPGEYPRRDWLSDRSTVCRGRYRFIIHYAEFLFFWAISLPPFHAISRAECKSRVLR